MKRKIFRYYKFIYLYFQFRSQLAYKRYYKDLFKFTIISLSKKFPFNIIVQHKKLKFNDKKKYWFLNNEDHKEYDELKILYFISIYIKKPSRIIYQLLHPKFFFYEAFDLLSKNTINKIDKKSDIADFACGAGQITYYLKKKYHYKNCHAFDVNKEFLSFAKNNFFKKDDTTKFFSKDLNDSEFLDKYSENFFSHSFCISFLNYLSRESLEKFLFQIKRVSKNVIIYERSASNINNKYINNNIDKILVSSGFNRFISNSIKEKEETLYFYNKQK